jgi:DNA-binding LacI/PurR family transcriptional regulator
MPTIKDVAKAAGVSIATVSYVLNNRDDMVSEPTRQQVLEVAQRLGYRANITARNLQSSRASLIGYAWHTHPGDQSNMVMNEFIYHLAQAAESVGYHLVTFTHPSDDPITVYDEIMRSGRVDGFVLAETHYDDPRIQFLLRHNIPFVSFGRANHDWDFNWVDTDGQAGMKTLTEYLLDLGHRRIAFLGWPRDSLTGNYRLNGYQAALAKVGIMARADYIIHNDYAHNSIERAFDYWLSLPSDQQPTAIVAVSDFVAISAMRIAEKCGFHVGETLSIAGFDDAPFVRFLQPGLTTLRQPFEQITLALVEQLQKLIRGEATETIHHLFAPELIIRESTARPAR